MFKNFFFLLTLPIMLLGLILVVLSWVLVTTPDVLEMKGCMTTSMYQVHLCPKDASYTPLDKISTVMQQAVLVSEDSSFFSHNGFDWFEIKNSFNRNMQEKTFARGGSTITQQLAKNVFLNKDKTLMRKLREALLTYQIEKNFTKKEILEKYLNVVEFGPGIYGVRAAAQYYFKKSPSDLHLLEASFLAFLLPNPKEYSASFNKKVLTKFARQRVLQIVFRLSAFKKIPESSFEQAKSLVDTFPWTQITAANFAPVSTVLENQEGEPATEMPAAISQPVVNEEPPAPEEPLNDQPTLEPANSEGGQEQTKDQEKPEGSE